MADYLRRHYPDGNHYQCPNPDDERLRGVTDADLDPVLPEVVSILYHHNVPVYDDGDGEYPALCMDHVRRHARTAWTIVRCLVRVIVASGETCRRLYAPGSAGYELARVDFKKLTDTTTVDCLPVGPPSDPVD